MPCHLSHASWAKKCVSCIARQRHSSSSLSSFSSSGSLGVARVVVVVRAFGGPPPRVIVHPYMGCPPSCHVCVGHALMPVCVCACHAHAMPCVCSRTHRHSYHVRGSPANDHLAEHSSAPHNRVAQPAGCASGLMGPLWRVSRDILPPFHNKDHRGCGMNGWSYGCRFSTYMGRVGATGMVQDG